MKKLTEFLDLPLVQRFLDNRLAIGAACALMVVAGVVDFHCFGVEVRFEGVVGVAQRGKGVRHDYLKYWFLWRCLS